jgi:hypothetical protein
MKASDNCPNCGHSITKHWLGGCLFGWSDEELYKDIPGCECTVRFKPKDVA